MNLGDEFPQKSQSREEERVLSRGIEDELVPLPPQGLIHMQGSGIQAPVAYGPWAITPALRLPLTWVPHQGPDSGGALLSFPPTSAFLHPAHTPSPQSPLAPSPLVGSV